MEWTKEQQQALNWAIKQSFPSVAATYAKILAEMIIQLEAENERLWELLSDAPGAPVFVYVFDDPDWAEIQDWVRKFATWTMRRLKALGGE